MRHKFLNKILLILSVLLCALYLFACTHGGNNTSLNPQHTTHSFINYIYNNDATCVDNGTETAKCEYCAETDTRTKSGTATGVHTFKKYVYNNDATCVDNGTETAKCEYCAEMHTRLKLDTAIGHSPSGDYYATNTVHWKSCATCEKHADEIVHTYNNKNVCFECGYELVMSSKLNYDLGSDGSYYIVSGLDLDINTFIIPSYYNEKPVKLGGNISFHGSNFTRIVLTNGINEIPTQAFMYLYQLRDIIIPESVTSVGMFVFQGCEKMTDIWCEAPVQPQGWDNSWLSSTGSNVIIHWGNEWHYVHGVPVLNAEMNYDEDAHVFSKVFSTDYNYHWYEPVCGHDASINKNVHEFDSDFLCRVCGFILNYTTELTYNGDDEYTVTGLNAMANDVKVINIPETYLNKPITSVAENAFKDRIDIVKVIIPNSIKTIGNNAFSGCKNLTTIIIGDNVISIGDRAFYGCVCLKELTIPNTVKNIGDYAFYGSATEIFWNDSPSLTSISRYMFSGYKGINLVIPTSVKSIANSALNGCSNLISLTLPFVGDQIRTTESSLGSHLFGNIFGVAGYAGCVSAWQTYRSDRYGKLDFISTGYCIPGSLRSVKILGGNILEGAFSGCSTLTNIEISNSTQIIGSYAFQDCSSLTSIEIPDSVTSVGGGVFYGCINLKSVIMSKQITALPSILYISEYRGFFDGCSSITNIEIPNSVTKIGRYAFKDCSSLTDIKISNKVMIVDGYVFRGCACLTIYCEVDSKPAEWSSDWNSGSCPVVWNCKKNEIDIDGYAYAVIDGIRYSLKNGRATVIRQPSCISGDILIPASVIYNSCEYIVTSINGAFPYNSSITSVEIPDSVTSIRNGAFYNCSSLTSIRFNGTKALWITIVKDSNWIDYTDGYTIVCTDDNVAK